MRGWRRLVPSKSYVPVTYPILVVCAVELSKRGHSAAACALLLGFDAYLRHSELSILRAEDVALPGDPRIFVSAGSAVVLLRFPKAGKPQWVTVRSPIVVAGLRALKSSRAPSVMLFGADSLRLLELFKQSQLWAGLPSAVFVIHSLRHGGATHDFLTKTMPFEEIRLHGRWQSRKVCQRYIQAAQALVAAVSAPPTVAAKSRLYAATTASLRRWLRW